MLNAKDSSNLKIQVIKDNLRQVGEIIDYGRDGVIIEFEDGKTLGVKTTEVVLQRRLGVWNLVLPGSLE